VVATGEALLDPSVTRQLVEAFFSKPVPDAPRKALLSELTERERDVVVFAYETGLIPPGRSLP
jgi:DNA-binding NarL/FixJ family response regulator